MALLGYCTVVGFIDYYLSVASAGFLPFRLRYCHAALPGTVFRQSCPPTAQVIGVNFAVFVLSVCSFCSGIFQLNVAVYVVTALQCLCLVHSNTIEQSLS